LTNERGLHLFSLAFNGMAAGFERTPKQIAELGPWVLGRSASSTRWSVITNKEHATNYNPIRTLCRER
jgi:hypothetical protein